MQTPSDGPPSPETPPESDPLSGDAIVPARRLTWRELAARFPITLSLTIVTLVFFGLEWVLGGTSDVQAQLRLGALRGDLVFEDGEYFRLICTAFVHHTIIHLGMNWLAFLQLGALVEHVFGSWRLLAIYLGCAVTGSLCSGLLMAPIPGGSRGASGAVMGLAGLLLGASWFATEPTRSGLRALFGRRLLYGVLLTFGLGIGLLLVFPVIDNWGHFGGFAGGLIAAWFLRTPEEPTGPALKALALGLSLATLVSFAWMARDGARAADSFPHDQAAYQRAHVDDPLGLVERALGVNRAARLMLMLEAYEAAEEHEEGYAALESLFNPEQASSDELNLMAWTLVTRRDVANRDPERARVFANQALERIPDDDAARGRRAGTLDTLAESLIQLDRLPEALKAQQESVRLGRGYLPPATSADLDVRLARIYLALGNRTAARAALMEAKKSAPEDYADRELLDTLWRTVDDEGASIAPVGSA